MKERPIKLLQGIDTLILRVSNVANSRDWYLEKLELALLFEDVDNKLIVLDTNGPTGLTLWQADQPFSVNPDVASYPIFKTPDAEALKSQLLHRGIEVGEVVQDAYVKYFQFYDPDGNVLEACQVYE